MKNGKILLVFSGILKKSSSSSGTGIKSTGSAVVIPSDPNALLKRLEILMASKEAGNTGVKMK